MSPFKHLDESNRQQPAKIINFLIQPDLGNLTYNTEKTLLRGIKNALSLKPTDSTQSLFENSLSYEGAAESDNESSENERSSLSDESYFQRTKRIEVLVHNLQSIGTKMLKNVRVI